jgi:hypothetical protein
MGSGQWAVGSGQWAVGSGQWAVGSGQWAVDDGLALFVFIRWSFFVLFRGSCAVRQLARATHHDCKAD